MQTVDPPVNATGVDVNTTIQITFSEPVSSADLNSTVFTISPTASASFSQASRTVTITPTTALAWGTAYTVTITTALSDTAGNNLANQYTWSFVTRINPNGTPPAIIAVNPTEGATGVSESTFITAQFSKPMDTISLKSAFGVIKHGGATVGGTVSYTYPTATFIPDSPLEYNTVYDVAITTVAKDTFDINLTTRKDWSFTTRPDPNVPVASWLTPGDSTIIDDTITVFTEVLSAITIDSVRLYVNGSYYATSYSGWFFPFSATAYPIGEPNRLHVAAYAGTGVGYSDTLTIFNKWELLDDDFDPIGGIPQDFQRFFYRTTDSTVEFRCEFSAKWGANPVADTALDLAMYFDTDQSILTGRRDFSGHDLNDIGAEKRVIIGLHGAVAIADWSGTAWDSLGGPELFTGLILYPDTNFFEVGLRWTDLDNGNYVNLVAVNAFYPEPDAPIFDWSPNEGAGHHTIKRAARYLGEGVITPPSMPLRLNPAIMLPPNPFD